MLDIQDIQVAFGDLKVLRGIDLSIGEGEIVCLLGPSGCGKTTLLRVIAGLEAPQSGEVLLNQKSILTQPVHQRGFGLMFQDFALFPHLTVSENVAFGLAMQRVKIPERGRRVHDVLELVGLTGYEGRDTAELSGGERQRVALARSLAPNPHLLMLDEPLGSLDAVLRERLIIELRTIIKRIGLTAIYVTHDQHEAFVIADRIALMNGGQIEQIGTPQAIYQQPTSPFVARFLGLNNIFSIIGHDGKKAHTAIGDFQVEGEADALLLHSDMMTLGTDSSPETISGVVESSMFLGDTYRIVVKVGENETIAFKFPALNMDIPQIGERVAVRIAPGGVIPLHSRSAII